MDIKGNSYMANMKELDKAGKARYRMRVVRYALNHDISKSAKEFGTTRKTVRKWVEEYHAQIVHNESKKVKEPSKVKLSNKSRSEQAHPNKLDENTVNKIILLRLYCPQWGAELIKAKLGLTCSTKTINKKLKQHGLIRKPEKKHKKDSDMAWMRTYYKALSKMQFDTKDLIDIPNYWKGVWDKRLPRYEFTARDYITGDTFIGYASHKDSTSMGIFVAYVICCLICAGVDLSKVHFQSDHGSEFENILKKNGVSLFRELCTKHGIEIRFIPVRSPTYNSDVESFHGRIEKEFYDIEPINNQKTLFYKAWQYMIWYNTERPNRNKGRKSPLAILQEHNIHNAEMLTTFPPIFVDNYIKDIELVKKGGYFKWSALRLWKNNT
jgi:transposase